MWVHADDEGDFFYNEDEVMAGADPEQREAMLAHYDSILRGPDEEELDEVSRHATGSGFLSPHSVASWMHNGADSLPACTHLNQLVGDDPERFADADEP